MKNTFKKMNDCATASGGGGSANGGQVLTLSPTAGDAASGAGDQPASSSAVDLTGDAEGVWSSDIDQAFQEALAIYPPCGRRKIIISDEGKMYGRNELIARYIKIRCGKTRTRKQVSSHIQVLARKKARDDAAKKKAEAATNPTVTPVAPPAITTSPTAPTSALPSSRIPATLPNFPQIPAIPTLPDPKEQLKLLQTLQGYNPVQAAFWNPIFQHFPATGEMKPFQYPTELPPFVHPVDRTIKQSESPSSTLFAVESSTLRLNGFTAYVEGPREGPRVDIVSIPGNVGEIENLKLSDISEKFPELLVNLFNKGPTDAFYLAKCWANVRYTVDDLNSFFAVDSYYTSSNKFDISVSTKVCSFGEEQVEKIEVYSPHMENGQYCFRLDKSPMCDYMVRFINKLKELDSEDVMNDVLENFTVLQVITNKSTEETLMVLCFLFEVNKEPDTTYSLYRLTA